MSKILVRHLLYINTWCYPPNKNNTRLLPSAIAFLYVVQYMFATLTYSIDNSFHTALLSPCFASRLRAIDTERGLQAVLRVSHHFKLQMEFTVQKRL